MFSNFEFIIMSCLTSLVTSELVAPGIDRMIPDGVKSTGYQYKVLYGDEELTVLNEVVSEAERSSLKIKDKKAFDTMGPLPAQDVKCLMSADKYCSSDMRMMKLILIEAIKEDCKTCSKKDKDKAGRIIASMMIYDPVAWKIFLTRETLQRLPYENKEFEEYNYKAVGEPEEVFNKKNRVIKQGTRVRVRRYAMEIFPKK